MAALDPGWFVRLGPPYRPGSGRVPPREPFEAIRATIVAPAQVDELEGLPAYQLARELFAAGYFWETHEVLEALWLAAIPNTAARHLLQGAIQCANAALKAALEQVSSARRIRTLALQHLADAHRAGADPRLLAQWSQPLSTMV